MRTLFLAILITINAQAFCQHIDSVSIPKGVVYKYSDPSIVEKAKSFLVKELSDSVTYNLDNRFLFIGPVLWSRYKNISLLNNIPGGNLTLLINNQKVAGKVIQDKDGFKKVWDQVRSEVNGNNLVLRKATYKELEYYWAVISFDIDEPLIIAEAGDHRFIMNLDPKKLELLWLDEVPDYAK